MAILGDIKDVRKFVSRNLNLSCSGDSSKDVCWLEGLFGKAHTRPYANIVALSPNRRLGGMQVDIHLETYPKMPIKTHSFLKDNPEKVRKEIKYYDIPCAEHIVRYGTDKAYSDKAYSGRSPTGFFRHVRFGYVFKTLSTLKKCFPQVTRWGRETIRKRL